METYICVSAAEPGNFDNHDANYEIVVVINNKENYIKISKEEFEKLKNSEIIYNTVGEYPVSIYNFKENV